ncbi:MAG: hypothetical protein CM15mP25_0340 [Gammaproteobacteria bacterium]|nr:MAG: hypothetical protein CM15mP25_0340 [Gammaproteobacteria bacterium]
MHRQSHQNIRPTFTYAKGHIFPLPLKLALHPLAGNSDSDALGVKLSAFPEAKLALMQSEWNEST